MDLEDAEVIALRALIHVVGNQKLCSIFIEKTGLDEVALRERIRDRDHLAGILDYILSEEILVTTFCEECNIPPDHALKAWQTLTGPLPDM